METNPKQLMIATEQDCWIDEKKASHITGMSRAWFQRKRWLGDGIPYTKVERACRYKIRDINSWMDSRRTISTSQRPQSVCRMNGGNGND